MSFKILKNKKKKLPDFELVPTLGTTFEIKRMFKKSYIDVIKNLEHSDAEDLCKILYCGLKSKEKYTLEEFTNLIAESCGFIELIDVVKDFIIELQYSGISDDRRAELEEEGKKKI